MIAKYRGFSLYDDGDAIVVYTGTPESADVWRFVLDVYMPEEDGWDSTRYCGWYCTEYQGSSMIEVQAEIDVLYAEAGRLLSA